MIIVDCKEVRPILHDLAIYLADNIQALPTLKNHEFILSPIDEEALDNQKTIMHIRKFLSYINEENNFQVTNISKKIKIQSRNGEKIQRKSKPVKTLRTCCGF